MHDGGRRWVVTGLLGAYVGCAPPAAPPPPPPPVVVTAPSEVRTPLTEGQRRMALRRLWSLDAEGRLGLWRAWAASDVQDAPLRREALRQLAWLQDQAAVPFAIRALASPDEGVRTMAARCLAEVGPPAALPAREALEAALARAGELERPAHVWALVVLGERSRAATALALGRSGQLDAIERLDEGPGFEPALLAAMVSADEVLPLLDDDRPVVRALGARLLGERATVEQRAVLTSLVHDADAAVAGEAGCGLLRIGDEQARGVVLDALRQADKVRRLRLLEILRDRLGAEGLGLGLETAVPAPEAVRWFQIAQTLAMLEQLADERMSEVLLGWLERARPEPHFRAEVGFRLAEVGDLRGASLIAERLGLDGARVYAAEKFWQTGPGGHLGRGDLQRLVGARLLADLAAMHPEARASLREVSGQAVLDWLRSTPVPHANGLRFLAAVGDDRALVPLRAWAFPKEPLPAVGAAPPFPYAFEIAHSALRYLGRMRDAPSLPKLVAQLDRRTEPRLDVSYDALAAGRYALLGMALRALAVGAANGLAEWGPADAGVADRLMALIEDPTWNEDARAAGCRALGSVGTEESARNVVGRLRTLAASREARAADMAVCYATSLARRAEPRLTPELVSVLGEARAPAVREAIARAIGASGVASGSPEEARLLAALGEPSGGVEAALALVLGADTTAATRAAAEVGYAGAAELAALEGLYESAIGGWTSTDVERGALARYARNAEAIGRMRIDGVCQRWASERLGAQLRAVVFDSGPRSETRPVLRNRLRSQAREGSSPEREDAIRLLVLLREQGALLALSAEPGPTGALARRGYHVLMNPPPAGHKLAR